jgi:hypothetical protein
MDFGFLGVKMIFESIKRILVRIFGQPAPEPVAESEMPWVGAARVLGEVLAAIEAHDASKQADDKEAQ